MASALGLNEHHQTSTVNYLRFARYQRAQRMKAVDLCFKEIKESRLTDDTFTIDEVTEILDSLQEFVKAEVESEFIHSAHTNVLLLRQLFQQAEKWHLKLSADISELENRELLEKIKAFEDLQFAGVKEKDLLTMTKLQPVNEGGAVTLLQMEIERLRVENQDLRQKLGLASSASGASKEVEALLKDLEKTKLELQQQKSKGSKDAEVEVLRSKMSGLESSLMETQKTKKMQEEKLEGELTNTKHELLRIQEMLEMAEKELEKKVGQTAPFKNLQQMLQKKNDQLKDLRKRLSKYETLD